MEDMIWLFLAQVLALAVLGVLLAAIHRVEQNSILVAVG
jgi:isopenicillin N synthase-like dioxygenase